MSVEVKNAGGGRVTVEVIDHAGDTARFVVGRMSGRLFFNVKADPVGVVVEGDDLKALLTAMKEVLDP